MSYVFGIDLGTTYSCVSYIDEYGKAVVLKNSDGDHTTPSVVFVESKDSIIVGTEAKRSVEVEASKTVQFIKRKMGREEDTVFINNEIYHAPEISSMILKKIVADANEELRQTGKIEQDETICDVVITCPAYFGMNERQATKTAGELAGLNVLDIINEPTAAAISYGVSGANRNETVLVYDLGGGTFDITVMSIEGNSISVVCTGGDDQLGGKDWDEALMEYVIKRCEEELGEDISEDMELISRLYVDVEAWKKSLTVRQKVNISVTTASGRFREELTREKFDEITSNILNRSKNLLDEVILTAEKRGYPLSRIDKVLLVGGSSRMPQVAEMIQRDYHIVPALTDPDEAVSKGAAIYANNEKTYQDFILDEAQKNGKTVEEVREENLLTGEYDKKFAMMNHLDSGSSKISIANVLSRTYGLEIQDGDSNQMIIFNMLMMNDKLPAKRTERFFTVCNNQSSIDIRIFESRSSESKIDIEGRTPLTVINMRFSKSVPNHTEVVMTMALDNSGILHIIAEEMEYHSKLETTFELSNQMTKADMDAAVVRMASATVE